jgi:glucosylglycerate synthase
MTGTIKTQVENIEKVRQADIIIGMPSYNEADTISNVTATADQGLQEYFQDNKAVIINADNHSTDGTKDVFLGTPTKTPKIYISTPGGQKGKGNNCLNLFRAAVELNAKAVVMIDADLTSFTPKWIHKLGAPVFQGFDYVSPIYERHKYDASITNHFVSPLVQALFGQKIRQPIGGDFGFSGKVAMAYLSAKSWNENVANFGIDVWMTINAITGGFKTCQTFLGSSKSHRVKDPAQHLAPMFTNVISTIFDLMIDFEYYWKGIEGSQPGKIFGFGIGVNEKPPKPSVDTEKLYDTFCLGFKQYEELWQQVLPQDDFLEIEKLLLHSKVDFYYSTKLWVRLLYNFAVAYRNNMVSKKQLTESMIPFYYSRMLSYINKTREWDTCECEEYLEEISKIYEKEKAYLFERWNEDKYNPSNSLFFTD